MLKDGQRHELEFRSFLQALRFSGISTKDKLKLGMAAPILFKRIFATQSTNLKQIAHADIESLAELISRLASKELVKTIVDPVITTTFAYEEGENDISANYALA